MNIFLIVSIFSIISLQRFSCDDVCKYTDKDGWNWEQNRKNFTSLNRSRLAKHPHRLRAYVHAYKTSRKNFLDHFPRGYEISEEKQEILQNEFIANPIGEYSLNYEINNGLRRVETGVFEKNNTGAYIFVVRGLISVYEDAVTYKVNNTGFYRDFYPRVERKYLELAAEALLCACCAQYDTCSNLCDTTIPVYKDCAPKVSDENLPKIKEQSFSVNTNGSYELRIIFGDDFYERTELFEYYKEFNGFETFGLFPYPKKPRKDLLYYFTGRLYTDPKDFPGLLPPKCFPPFLPPSTHRPIDIDYSNIGIDTLRSCVG